MVTIIESIPGFGRNDVNWENKSPPKRIEVFFPPERRSGHGGFTANIFFNHIVHIENIVSVGAKNLSPLPFIGNTQIVL
jgi:hypothetical protein